MNTALDSRNTVCGFSDRVCKNFEVLADAKEDGKDVHLVTALITSLLGVIVFPVQKVKESKFAAFNELSLQDLQQAGWPAWQYQVGTSADLGHLLLRLRNAISHRRIVFSGEERELNAVKVTFSDRQQGAVKDNWRASIWASELLAFKLLVAKRLYQIEAQTEA